jgi:hypothetical protein
MADPDSVDSYVAERLSQALDTANSLTQSAENALQEAMTASSGFFVSGDTIRVEKPDFSLGGIDIPGFIRDSDLVKTYEKEYPDALKSMQDQFEKLYPEFLDKFFPALKKELIDLSDDWLGSTIRNGGLAVPQNVQDAHFQQARDRAFEAALVVKDSASDEFAARGFALPTGALASRFQQADLEAQKKAVEDNRQWAIETWKINLENLKFAVKEVIEIRKHADLVLKDYIFDYIRLATLASELAKEKVDIYQTLWNAIYEYYRTLVTMRGYLSDIDKFNSDMQFRHKQLDFQSFEVSLRTRTSAATSAAQLYAQTCASYVGAQNTLVHMSSSSIQEE